MPFDKKYSVEVAVLLFLIEYHSGFIVIESYGCKRAEPGWARAQLGYLNEMK